MKPEDILQKEKYKGLKNLVLICEAMDEYERDKQYERIQVLKEAKFVLEWMWKHAIPLTDDDQSDFFNLTANCLSVIDKQLEEVKK